MVNLFGIEVDLILLIDAAVILPVIGYVGYEFYKHVKLVKVYYFDSPKTFKLFHKKIDSDEITIGQKRWKLSPGEQYTFNSRFGWQPAVFLRWDNPVPLKVLSEQHEYKYSPEIFKHTATQAALAALMAFKSSREQFIFGAVVGALVGVSLAVIFGGAKFV
jgi:hypothetical protein